MGISRKKLKRSGFFVISFALVCLLLSLWCLLLLLNAYLPVNNIDVSNKLLKPQRTEDVQLGKLGEMMVAMLPDDLPFTVFMPSVKAFEFVLKLNSSESLGEQKVNDTFAILSRVMGFSTVPQHLPTQAVPIGKEISLDSVSGFRLYAHRLSDKTLVVNNVRAEKVDIRRGEIIVHIMGGVIMEAEFEQSFRPDYED